MALGLFSWLAPVVMDAVGSASKATPSPSPTVTPTLAAGLTPTIGPTLAPTVPPDVIGSASIVPLPNWLTVLFDKVDYVIMVPLVYIALQFCLIFLIVRIVKIFRAPPAPFTLKIFPSRKRPVAAALGDTFAMPQIRKHQPLFWFFLMVFHVSFLLLILGHLDILPRVSLVPEASRDMLGAGLVGVGVTVPLLYFLFRRFRTPNREISVFADYLLLILVIFLCLFGDLMSWGNSWTAAGFIMKKADFAQYFASLAHFTFQDPRLWLTGTHYHFAVIHVLLAELFFFILPFSKIVHAFLAAPINLLRRK